MDFTVEFVSRNLVTLSNFVGFRDSRNFTFSRHRVLGDTWHEHVDATWHPWGVTHGMSHVVHLCEWLTLTHVSKEGNKRKRKKIKKKCGDDKWHGE